MQPSLTQTGLVFDPLTRWARDAKLSAVRTLGGHRRYIASEVHALLDQQSAGSR